MRKYWSFFRVRFSMGLQYRAAALAGMATQFAWGFMTILMFRAFYQGDPGAFPMAFQALVSYIWLQQAFLALFMTWFVESDIFEAISSGQVAYEMCRPMDLYGMWWVRSCANRISKAVLRCVPVLTVSLLLPEPYGLRLPSDPVVWALFLPAMALGFGVVVALCMVMYGLTFYTVSPWGVRMFFAALVDFLSGGTVPLPFFPAPLRQLMELLPFGAMQNAPFQIFGGSLSGEKALWTLGLQALWLVLLTALGRLLFRRGIRRVVVQGG